MSATEFPLSTPLLTLMAFVVLWISVTWLLMHLCGWVALARIYRANREASGIPVRLRSARMGGALLGQFRNVLTLWVSTHGVQLHLMFLFAIKAPDLFFPWDEISVSRGRYFFFDYVELKFRQAPHIPLRIFGKAAEQVREAAGDYWPEVTTA